MGFMLLFAMVTGCVDESVADEPKEEPKTEVKEEKEEPKEAKEEPKDEPEEEPVEEVVEVPEEPEKDVQDLINSELAQLEVIFENDKVEYVEEEKTFYITPISVGFKKDIYQILLGNPDKKEEWKEFVETFRAKSETTATDIGEGYVYMVKNPDNHDNVILTIIDGLVVYDVFDESTHSNWE